MTPITVVVAGEPRDRVLWRRLLEPAGGISVVADVEAGQAAWAVVARLRPRVLLLDLRRPRLDVLAVLRRVDHKHLDGLVADRREDVRHARRKEHGVARPDLVDVVASDLDARPPCEHVTGLLDPGMGVLERASPFGDDAEDDFEVAGADVLAADEAPVHRVRVVERGVGHDRILSDDVRASTHGALLLRDQPPVEPKPPAPRSLAGSSSTGTGSARSTRWTTSWATRSPRRSVTVVSASWLTSNTFSSPR